MHFATCDCPQLSTIPDHMRFCSPSFLNKKLRKSLRRQRFPSTHIRNPPGDTSSPLQLHFPFLLHSASGDLLHRCRVRFPRSSCPSDLHHTLLLPSDSNRTYSLASFVFRLLNTFWTGGIKQSSRHVCPQIVVHRYLYSCSRIRHRRHFFPRPAS